jgi:hypothetical protein
LRSDKLKKDPEIKMLSVVINFVTLILCLSGFIYDINGIQNIHALAITILTIFMFGGFLVTYSDDIMKQTFDKIKKKIENGEKENYPKKDASYYLYSINALMQLIICCYFGAWYRVTLLVLYCFFIFALVSNIEKYSKIYKEKDEEEKVKVAQDALRPKFDSAKFDESRFN